EAAARPALVHALKEGNQNQRFFALLWLKRKERSHGFAVPALEALVTDRDAEVRGLVLELLIAHYSDKEALTALGKWVKHEKADVRCSALSQMAQMIREKQGPTDLIRMILPSLRGQVEDVRLATVIALKDLLNQNQGRDWKYVDKEEREK